jgi:hypothetical protein
MTAWRHSNALLAGACLILAALAHWQPGRPEAAQRRLSEVDPAQVAGIQVFHGAELRLDLLRDKDGWMMTHPEIRRADPRRVATLLALLSAPSRRQLDPNPAQRAAYGLAPPRARIRFDTHSLAFGETSPPGNLVYADSAGQVHLVDEVYRRLLDLPATHFTGVH